MLEAIRSRAASFVVKGLFIILALSFVVWGVADVVTPGGDVNYPIRVGERDVSAEILRSEYQRELSRLRAATGQRIDTEDAQALGVPAAIVSRVVRRTLLELGAADLPLLIDDAVVRTTIQENPAFRNFQGTFDRDRFFQALFASGLSEAAYVDALRTDIATSHLTDSITSGVVAPQTVIDRLYRFRGERRRIEMIRIPEARFQDVGQPAETDLATLHQDLADQYTAPEYRAVTAVVLKAADLAREIAVDDAAIDEAYAARSAEFNEPEQRTLRQIVLSDEDAANRARERLRTGDDFVTVAAEEADTDADALDIGTLTRNQLLPELAEAVFSLPQGEVSQPVESPLGWHLLQVTAIRPARSRTRDEVADELASAIAADQAVDALYDLSARLEDTLAGGASLEEAAGQLGIQLLRVDAMDAAGRDRTGQPVAGLPVGLAGIAYRTEAGSESPLTDTDDGDFFVLRVDSVTPPTLRPLSEVRDDVVAAWRDRQQSERATAFAEELAERLRAAGDAQAIAKESGLDGAAPPAFDRFGGGAPPDVPAALIEAAFAAASGEVVVASGEEAAFAARVVEVLPAETVADAARRGPLAQQLADSFASDLLGQFVTALGDRHPIAINQEALEQVF